MFCIVYVHMHLLHWSFSAVVSSEQTPPRSWVHLKEPDRTRPTGERLDVNIFLVMVSGYDNLFFWPPEEQFWIQF